MIRFLRKNKDIAALVLASFIPAIVTLWMTPRGASVHPDSVNYFDAATNLLAGKGITVDGSPLNHFPPFYTIMLALLSLLGNIHLETAARVLNVLSFSLSVFLVAWMVFISTRRSLAAALITLIAMSTSGNLIEIHALAIPEPLFFLCLLLTMLFLSRFLSDGWISDFYASAFAIGIALLTRYAGICILAAAFLISSIGIWFRHPKNRWLHTFLWLVPACGPLIIFFLNNLAHSVSATNRNIVFHLIKLPVLADAANTINDYFLSPRLPGIFKTVAGVILIFAFIALAYLALINMLKSKDNLVIETVLPAVSLTLGLTYLVFLAVSISLVDAATPMNWRILSPIYIMILPGFLGAIWQKFHLYENRIFSWLVPGIMALVTIINIPTGYQTILDIHDKGRWYTKPAFQNSDSLAYLRTIRTDNVTVYSNGADVISYILKINANPLPRMASSTTLLSNPQYQDEIQELCTEMHSGSSLVVYLDIVDWRWYLPTKEMFIETCAPTQQKVLKDGVIFSSRNP